MKKKFLMAVLTLSMLLQTAGFAYADSSASTSSYNKDVIDTATTYLEEAAFARYYYEAYDINRLTISAVPSDELLELIKNIEKYPDFRADQMVLPYEETKFNTNLLSSFNKNLSLHQDCIEFYAHVNRLEKITYNFFNPSYNVVSVAVDGNLAAVDLYEILDFQYSNCEEPSRMMTRYYVSLVKHGNDWLVLAVESDDLFYQMYREVGFNLQKEIEGVTEAYFLNEQLELSHAHTMEDASQTMPRIASNTDRSYISQNAVNYALTYSTGTDTGSVPTYKNDKFYWTDASCQLFVSQCIWAGFGGSNSQTDINNRRGMDTTGSYQWWSTQTKYNNPDYNDPGSPNDIAWNSWIKCSQFKVYVDGVKNSSTESGILCDTNDVPYNSNDLVGTSGLAQGDLKGAALHVKGYKNGNPVELGHAVIINNATGTTRSTVYYTCYNDCKKNIQLSLNFPSSTYSSYNKIYVMVPRTLRDSNGATENYLYGDLQNALVKGNSGVTRTLYGRAKAAVATLTMRVYAPGATTASYTFTAYNKKVVSGSVLFNQTGEWRVVVSGTGLSSFTYLVRVV